MFVDNLLKTKKEHENLWKWDILETYRDFKYLPRRTTSGKILRDKGLNIAKNLEYDIKVNLLQWPTIFLIESLLHVNTSDGAI